MMRALRTLAAAALAGSVLAIPTLAAAQSDEGLGPAAAPLAREPHGRLPLQGTPWRLDAYSVDGMLVRPPPEIAAFIAFGPRDYEGSGGCSRLRGVYGVMGAAITVRPRQLTARACSEDLSAVQEAVERGLRQAASYEVREGPADGGDTLVISSVTGAEVLRYRLDDLALLDGSEWRLASYTLGGQTSAASSGTPGLLSFRPDTEAHVKRRQSGRLSGTTGCNGLVAEFTRRSDVLRLAEVELTDAPCPGELAAQEAAMTAVLTATTLHIDLPADRLTVVSAETGDQLEFVSQTPLEGTTWWLQRTAAMGATRNERITLRLEGGNATGEGPCGPFTASYTTDGAFISFADPRGARDESCTERRADQALISGLRRSVAIVRGRDTLELVDAYGSSQLEFGRPFAP